MALCIVWVTIGIAPTLAMGQPSVHAASLESVNAALLASFGVIGWTCWRAFGSARCAYVGIAGFALAIGDLTLAFGHGSDGLWGEVVTRAMLGGTTTIVLAALVAAVRSAEVDTRVGTSRLAVGAATGLLLASTASLPLVRNLTTDGVAVGVGVVLICAGVGTTWAWFTTPVVPWTTMAVGITGASLALHATPMLHGQLDLAAAFTFLYLGCLSGAIIDVREMFRTSQARSTAIRDGRDAAERAVTNLEHDSRVRAHELRNAVLALDGATTVILDRQGPDPSIEALRDAVTAELRRVRELLNLDTAPSDVTSVFDISEVLARQAVLARASGAMVLVDVPPSLKAHGDAGETDAVVRNLLLNAEHHGGGGPVDVWAAWDTDVVSIHVADRGPGVPPRLRDHAFDRPVASETGSGLGLHICATLARARGGDLRLTDRPGGGAVATYVLARVAPVEAVGLQGRTA